MPPTRRRAARPSARSASPTGPQPASSPRERRDRGGGPIGRRPARSNASCCFTLRAPGCSPASWTGRSGSSNETSRRTAPASGDATIGGSLASGVGSGSSPVRPRPESPSFATPGTNSSESRPTTAGGGSGPPGAEGEQRRPRPVAVSAVRLRPSNRHSRPSSFDSERPQPTSSDAQLYEGLTQERGVVGRRNAHTHECPRGVPDEWRR